MEIQADLFIQTGRSSARRIKARSFVDVICNTEFYGEPGWLDVAVQDTTGQKFRGYIKADALMAWCNLPADVRLRD